MTCLALVMSTVETAFTIQFPVDQTESMLLVFYVAAARDHIWLSKNQQFQSRNFSQRLGFLSQFVENFLTIFFFRRITFFALTLPEGKNENPHFHPSFFCMSGPGVENRLGHVF